MMSLSANNTQDRQMATHTPTKAKLKASGNVMPNARSGQPEMARCNASREGSAGWFTRSAGRAPWVNFAELLLLRIAESDPTRPSPTYHRSFVVRFS